LTTHRDALSCGLPTGTKRFYVHGAFFMQALRNELHGLPGKFYPVKVDVCSEESILEGFAWAKTTLKSVDVLVNNAGVCLTGELLGKYVCAMP
jgi:NADP-dependent 3-hydroxy acid dehydrogenase YdfG